MTIDTWQTQKPVLIIGGGGFLGTNLTNRLCAQGASVINLSRSWLVQSTDAPVRYERPDPTDSGQIARLIKESALVYHMAHGFSPSTAMAQMDADLLSSMALTFQVMQACEEAEVAMIYLSSGGTVYGGTRQVPTPETAETHPISPYGLSKLTAERYLQLRRRLKGLDYRILRISNPYGPWQFGHNNQGVIGTWIHRIRTGAPIEIWGDGEVVRDYIYVDDVSGALIAAAQYDGDQRIFNIGSGEGLSLNSLVDALRDHFGTALQCNYKTAAPADVPVSILDIGLARQELDWQPKTGLQEGLRQTLAWSEENDLLTD